MQKMICFQIHYKELRRDVLIIAYGDQYPWKISEVNIWIGDYLYTRDAIYDNSRDLSLCEWIFPLPVFTALQGGGMDSSG